MLDVHPPHHAASTLRDFSIHIATIVIGLLIALSLEAGVEALHHRHILHVAEHNLKAELNENMGLIAKDQAQLVVEQKQFTHNLEILYALRNRKPLTEEPTFDWHWSGTQNAAWNTARDTGALALMTFEDAQGLTTLYGQQQLVEQQATVFINDVYRASVPLEGGANIATLQPAQIDAMISATQQVLSDINYLHDLCRGLDYNHAESRL